jgi:hypothetical protein
VVLDKDIDLKVCKRCMVEKPKNSFCKNVTKKDGLSNWCSTCKSESDKAYREKNIEYSRKKSRDYYAKNSEAIKIKVREYASKNQEAIKIKRLEYYQKNKLKWSTYQIERAAVDPVYKMKVSIRKLLVKVMSGSKTQRCEEILGCSYSELHNHIESQFEPWMTWENKGKYSGTLNYGWDVDHIIPLCTAKTVEDIIRLNHYTNLRPLCSHVNRNIKRGKYE